MRKLVLSLSVLSILASPLAKAECVPVVMPGYSEMRCQFSDLHDSDQQEVENDFIDQVRGQISKMKMPKKDAQEADLKLEELHKDIAPIVDKLTLKAQNYRRGRALGAADLVPNGFIAALGGNGSVGAGLSAGASILVAIAAVPTFIKRIDSFTGAETHRIEWQFDLGGIIQGGLGAGGGIGVGLRGGVGLIFGDLPNVSDLFASGFAWGFDGDAQVIAGMGVSAIFPKNKTTGLKNLILYTHADTGAAAKIEVHGCGFELVDKDKAQSMIPWLK
jgi:hypothetical protein